MYLDKSFLTKWVNLRQILELSSISCGTVANWVVSKWEAFSKYFSDFPPVQVKIFCS